MNILITGARSYVAYEWGKALCRQHQVYFADSLCLPLSRFSSFHAGYLKHRAPALDAEGFKQDLLKAVSDYRIDLIIPTCEEVFYLSAIKEALGCEVFCDDHDTLIGLHHKAQVFGFFDFKSEVLVPRTKLVLGKEDIEVGQDEILKPVFSRFGAEVITNVSSRVKEAWVDTRPWVQQQKLTGQSWCNYAIAVHGKMLGTSTYKPGSRIENSAALRLDPVRNEAIETFTRNFIEHHRFHGQIAFDFMEHEGSIYVIECNPRGTSGIHLLRHCDLEPALFARSPIAHDMRAKQFGFATWLYRLSGKLNTSTDSDDAGVVDVLASPGDARIKLLSVLSLAEIFIQSVRYRCKLTEASSHDIEWNG